MKSISLYTDNNSWMTKLHPFTKLFYLVSVILIPVISGHLMVYIMTAALSIIGLLSTRVFRKALPLITFSFSILLTIFIIQGLFYKDNASVLFTLGPLKFYREGLLYSSRIGLNILNMLLSFSVLVLTTKPSELVEEFEKKGFSPKLGYVINSVFQIVPEMMGTMETISDAQRSRGMETEGNLLTRIKAFLPLISPVVMSALTSTRERAIALEVRGFGCTSKKTYLYSHPYRTPDKIIKWVSILSLIGVIVWKILNLFN